LNRKAKARLSEDDRKAAAAAAKASKDLAAVTKRAEALVAKQQLAQQKQEKAQRDLAAKAVLKAAGKPKKGKGPDDGDDNGDDHGDKDSSADMHTEAEIKAGPAMSSIKCALTSVFPRAFIGPIRQMEYRYAVETKRAMEVAMAACLLNYDERLHGRAGYPLIDEAQPFVANSGKGPWKELFMRCLQRNRQRVHGAGAPVVGNICDNAVTRALHMVMGYTVRLARLFADCNIGAEWAAGMDRATRTMHGLGGIHGMQRVLERVAWAVYKRAVFARIQAHPNEAGLYAPVFNHKAHVRRSVRTALIRAIMMHQGFYRKDTQRAQLFPAARAETVALLNSDLSRRFIEEWQRQFLGGQVPVALDGHDGIITKLAIATVLRQWPMVPMRFRCFALARVEAIHATLAADDRRRVEGLFEPSPFIDDFVTVDDEDDTEGRVDDEEVVDDADEPVCDDDVLFDEDDNGDAAVGHRRVGLRPCREITPRLVPILPGYSWRCGHFRFGQQFMEGTARHLGLPFAANPNYRSSFIARYVKDSFARKYARRMPFFGNTFVSDGTAVSVYFTRDDAAEPGAKHVHSVGHKGSARTEADDRRKVAKEAEEARNKRYEAARKSKTTVCAFMRVWQWTETDCVDLPIYADETAAQLRARIMAETGWLIPGSNLQGFSRLTPDNSWVACPSSGSLGVLPHCTELKLVLNIKARYLLQHMGMQCFYFIFFVLRHRTCGVF
jgi:hypothetical protein